MPTDRMTYAVEHELDQLREEVRLLRESQEEIHRESEKEHRKKDDGGNKEKSSSDRKEQDDGKEKDEQNKPELTPQQRRTRMIIIGALVLTLAGAAVLWWLHARQFETTDDAQVDGHISGLAARIAGTITAVHAEESQTVQAGQLIAELDSSDYAVASELARSQLAQAQAQSAAEQPSVPATEVTTQTAIATSTEDVANAQASVAAAQHNYEAALAKVREAEANDAKAQADVGRYRPLAEKDEVPREQFDQVLASARASTATVAAARASAEALEQQADQSRLKLTQARQHAEETRTNAPGQVDIRRANLAARKAGIQAASAQLNQARLNLSYTQIRTPVGGIVAKRIAEVGQHVAPGQQIVLVMQTQDLWVTANYKETQLRKMRPGESVRLHVDALDRDYDGYVESLPAASGAATSLLPPENATGNFVKVVQRMPVRIRFTQGQEGLDRLRPGMSVEPSVRIE